MFICRTKQEGYSTMTSISSLYSHHGNHIMSFFPPSPQVGGAFVTCAVMTSICGYLSPYGYRGSYIQRRRDDDQSRRDDRNNLSLFDNLRKIYCNPQ